MVGTPTLGVDFLPPNNPPWVTEIKENTQEAKKIKKEK